MSDGPTAGHVSGCHGDTRNCELLRKLSEIHSERRKDAGLSDRDAVVSAMAVGLVLDVWRNSPVEDMHARRRGPDDAAMFAESTALHRRAINALTVPSLFGGLFDFEKHLLDRTRPWATTGGRTLTDLGYGSLGEYTRHVKNRIDALMGLAEHTCVPDALELYLVNRALVSGRNHRGMPRWPMIVGRIGILLSDPTHPAWRRPDAGQRAVAAAPPEALPIERLTATLLTDPDTLPDNVVRWLSHHLLHCAGPPYNPIWDANAQNGSERPFDPKLPKGHLK